MAKHLFRVTLVNPKDTMEEEIVRRSASFEVSDAVLKGHLCVHVQEMDASERWGTGLRIYGRDLMTEWGNHLAVHPSLSYPFLKKFWKKSPLDVLLSELNYALEVVRDKSSSHGGRFVLGKEFVLFSDDFSTEKRRVKTFLRSAGLDVPYYFLPSLTSIGAGHIDCDYAIVDPARVLYGSPGVFSSPGLIRPDDSEKQALKGLKELEHIARAHNFELREYKPDPANYLGEAPPDGNRAWDASNLWEEFSKRGKGINLIVDGRNIFTSEIHPEERIYLRGKGIEVVVVPLGKVNMGAGLRCIYGEFTV